MVNNESLRGRCSQIFFLSVQYKARFRKKRASHSLKIFKLITRDLLWTMYNVCSKCALAQSLTEHGNSISVWYGPSLRYFSIVCVKLKDHIASKVPLSEFMIKAPLS